jgi:uncharacterized protein involved in high-affinity Fe2+ transport
MKTTDLPPIRSSYGEVFGVGLWTVLREVASETDLHVAAEIQSWNDNANVGLDVGRILWNTFLI